MLTRDYRDLLIEQLVDDAVAIDERILTLSERVVVLESERDSFRLLALETLRHATELTRQLEVLDQRRYVHRQRVSKEAA